LFYEDWSEHVTIPAWKHLYTWTFALSNNSYQVCDTDMTAAEIMTASSYISVSEANAMVSWLWYLLSDHNQ
jgi:hypothetical protein